MSIMGAAFEESQGEGKREFYGDEKEEEILQELTGI